MKPSDSKAARAARKRKSRTLKVERAERDKQAADDFGKLSTVEKIAVHDIVKAQAARTKAEAPARVAAVIAKHEATVRKETLSFVTRVDSDGKQVRENIHIPETPSRWHEDRERESPRIEARDPQRPAEGKPMCQWSMAELEAEKSYQRCKNTPAGGGSHTARGFSDPWGTIAQSMHAENSGGNIHGWTAP